MNIFRLHIRPKGGLGSPDVSFAYCLANKLLGVGWQTYTAAPINSWEDYERETGGGHRTPRCLRNRVKPDDLIWTRCPEGNYYLGRVLSGWEYLTSKAAEDADIVNVVRCRILPVPHVDRVPGKVVACFRATRTLQGINGESVAIYTRRLWNDLSGAADDYPQEELHGSVFDFLDAEETEDVVFLYLQTKGWLVVPNSRKADTMRFEFYCIHRETKRRAIVQVKTGNTPLRPADWSGRTEHVFLFQSKAQYIGEPEPGVETLAPSEILAFLTEHKDILPKTIAFWLSEVKAQQA